jgi:MoxR-like ATPase
MDTMARLEADRLGTATDVARRLASNITSVVHGKDEEIRLVITALACEGHVLFEDVPGTAKTVLARAIAGSIDGVQFARIQCTPDLQPTDVTGLAIFDQKERDFEFRPGPVFAHVLLVDEINRAMPKTQSALLEAMAEGQVTVDGETRRLPEPFILLATENPIEHEGTFPLPEAQLDRFFLRTSLGYPDEDAELQIVRDQVDGHPLKHLRPVVTLAEVKELQSTVRRIYVDDLIQRWIVRLVRSTRELQGVSIGSSVRGTLALEHAARASALLDGREFVMPTDVERLLVPVLCHRIAFTALFHADARRTGWDAAIDGFRTTVLEQAPRPEMPDSEIGVDSA